MDSDQFTILNAGVQEVRTFLKDVSPLQSQILTLQETVTQLKGVAKELVLERKGQTKIALRAKQKAQYYKDRNAELREERKRLKAVIKGLNELLLQNKK